MIKFKIRKAKTKVSIHKVPKDLRGKTAERLVCAKLAEYGIDCADAEESYIDKLVFPFKKSARKTPLQIKSVSLKKHGYQIEVWPKPLKLFKGWYIILIEHEPDDFFLFVPSSEIKKRFSKAKERFVKKRPSLKALRLKIPSDLSGGWSDYLDPTSFIKDVFSHALGN